MKKNRNDEYTALEEEVKAFQHTKISLDHSAEAQLVLPLLFPSFFSLGTIPTKTDWTLLWRESEAIKANQAISNKFLLHM